MNGVVSDWYLRPGLVQTGDLVTPDSLSRYYNIPIGTRATHPRNIQSVAEFLAQYYSPDDLRQFFQAMDLPNQPVRT